MKAEERSEDDSHSSFFRPHPCKVMQVAAAVILRSDGQFLLAQRPAGKPYAGYWEFPGGKLLANETPLAALTRELKEELDIDVIEAWPWVTRGYSYPHANVRLNFFRVARWRGNVRGLEAQALAWQRPGEVSVTPMLPANAPILRALTLPPVYAISNAHEVGIELFLARLRASLQQGVKMIQLREKEMPAAQFRDFAASVLDLAAPYEARVLLNSAHAAHAEEIGAHGVHFTADHLLQAGSRPDFELCGASCHDAAELKRAAGLEFDFAVLGPVQKTPTHRDDNVMGWRNFSRLVSGYSLPVYAIGGMRAADLRQAFSAGAQGAAMIRGAWEG